VLKQRITEKRIAVGITQAELARRSHLTPSAISQIENGSRFPTLPTLYKIADALNVSLDYLIGRSNSSEIEFPVISTGMQDFLNDFKLLSPEDQNFIKENIKFLKERI